MNFVSIVELRDATLGRILVRNLSVSAISAIEDLPEQGLSADEFVARFLAALARKVPDEAAQDHKSYEAGAEIDLGELTALSPNALDCLAAAYIDKTHGWNQHGGNKGQRPDSPDGAKPLEAKPDGVQPGERQTQRLLRIVKDAVRVFRESLASVELSISDEMKKSFASMAELGISGDVGRSMESISANLKKTMASVSGLGISDELRRSAEHTSRLARDVDHALSDMRTPRLTSEVPRPSFEMPELAPNPVWETNRQLAELTGSVAQLVNVARHQAELSQAIRKTSELALSQAVQSREDAKAAALLARKSVRLTFWAIVFALLTAILSVAFTVNDNRNLNTASDGRVKEEIRILQEISRKLSATDNRSKVGPALKPNPQTEPQGKTRR